MTGRMMRACVMLAVLSSTLHAQVGSTPEQSPFRDTEIRQNVSLLLGQSFGGRDNVGAGPRGGTAVGVRYDINLGASPIAFTSILMRQAASRDILQPGLPLANRIGATVSQPLWMLDLAFSVLLTGNRSWHSFVPSATLGVGIVTDNKSITDSSKFEFGNRFAPILGFGLKYAPQRSRWTVRADVTNRFYSVPYPQSFRDSTPGVPRVVQTNIKKSWTRNTMLTLGLVREIGRR